MLTKANILDRTYNPQALNYTPWHGKLVTEKAPGLKCLAPLIGTIATVDTAWIRLRDYHRDFISELKGSGAKDVKVRRIRGPNGVIYWRAVRITKPTEATWQVWRRWTGPKKLLARIDIAVDFHFPNSWTAQRFKDWCAGHLRLRWNRHVSFWYDETKYWCDHRRKKQPQRSLIGYTNKDDGNIVRLELKLQSTSAVRKNPWHKPRDLFEKHIAVKEVSPRFVERQVRRAVGRRACNPRDRGWGVGRERERVVAAIQRGLMHGDPWPTRALHRPPLFDVIPVELSYP